MLDKATALDESDTSSAEQPTNAGGSQSSKEMSPNSSEMHLAEQQDAVPDLLPTQGDNLLCTKIIENLMKSK